MRNAVSQASNAANTAQQTGAGFGGQAQTVNSSLEPFLTQEMLNPTGYSQQDIGAQQAAAMGGAGGAASALTGQAEQRAAASHNAGGYQAALDSIARERQKAEAGASENIAAKNADLKQQQMQEGAAGLGNLYKTDTSAMLEAMWQVPQDVNAEVNADKSGWLQNTMGILQGLNTPGFKGFSFGKGG